MSNFDFAGVGRKSLEFLTEFGEVLLRLWSWRGMAMAAGKPVVISPHN